jgi:ABC-type dipeptide/oligopeptide/nickel transport system permease component
MSALARYAIKKILIGIPVVVLVTLLLFLIMKQVPGDPIRMIAGERVTKETIDELRRSWGLDQPTYIQFFYWFSKIMSGDFGYSYVTRQPVSFLIWSRLPYTLELTLPSLVLSYVLGVPLGIIAALGRGKSRDYITMGISNFFYSMPTYWLGLMLMLVFGLYLRWFPISGTTGGLESLVLPTLTYTLPFIAFSARIARTEMLEVLGEDYIRTAWAKGLTSGRVILKHALRNALIPVTVMFFLDLPWIIGGAVIVESVFSWPGMGNLLYKSILRLDYPVILAIVFVIAILIVICNIVGDVVSATLDPRIRVETEKM